MDLVFMAAAAVTVGAALLVVTQRNPIYSAMAMLVSFLGLAVIYLRLEAPFLAAIHVLVYTGAILVLFLFVIMLLNLKPEELGAEYPLPVRGGIALLCAGLFGLIAFPLWQDGRKFGPIPAASADAGAFGSVVRIGNALFRDYALSFELISVLIMVAVFAGVLLAKRKL